MWRKQTEPVQEVDEERRKQRRRTRDELVSLLDDTKQAAAELESLKKANTQPTVEIMAQLLVAYRLGLDLITIIMRLL